MWTVGALIVTALSVYILTVGTHPWGSYFFNEFPNQIWAEICRELGMPGGLLLAELFFILIVSLVGQIVPIYLAIVLGGHLWPKHRILGAFAAYILLTIALQAVVSVVLAMYYSVVGWERLLYINSAAEVNALVFYSTIFSALLTAGMFFLTNLVMDKRLNLE